jgi:hypothetical protein
MFLVSSEKEFKNGYRGELSRTKFIIAKQIKSREKVYSPHRRVGRFKKGTEVKVSRPQAFLGCTDMGKVSLANWLMCH